MYNEDIVNNSFNKFIVLVDAYLEELNKKYFNVNRKISNNRVINNVVNSFSVENIIKYKDRLISLDDSLQPRNVHSVRSISKTYCRLCEVK